MINSLNDALQRIEELERENDSLKAENKALRDEIESLKARKLGGRKKHNEAWASSYQDFAVKYEAGMSIMEIVNESSISRRTAYRYKAYYDEICRGKEQPVDL
ncbi:MAG: helix-turn-helix domain-containing protein [Lachnospiraceae bacterium]|nr:helix-turn-helix domain-containing protein [Lachnospiraceae bacterium]